MTENRLIDIEIKIARQEDLLETLNQTVYRQQKKIDELERLCSALATHIRQSQDSGNNPSAGNEPPPHY